MGSGAARWPGRTRTNRQRDARCRHCVRAGHGLRVEMMGQKSSQDKRGKEIETENVQAAICRDESAPVNRSRS
ncbi:hypothetical protein IF1G_08027 [Cordyceps javanica]|uniref:Uncharacterized protein n=1 Tax=Cordyceps javanica TaxID=43265 RepID=A0A545VU28_9HYPO|nr:hypothetical protein IF1G_08027 [Cordyceps javanica]TQW05209.1 hypothetical protein IF2G_07146 [Cordyceps javanica]